MQTKYTVYYPNGNETQGEVDWPEAPSFDQINKLVNPIIGGLLEHVYVLDPAKADVPN